MHKGQRRGVEENELRRRAEAQLMRGETPAPSELPLAAEKTADLPTAAKTADLQRLVHELEVHQVELELQNEELRNARIELEGSLARYTEVFDFAPIGYATLTPSENIATINLEGARLLGQARKVLAGQRFAAFLAPESLPAWHALFHGASAGEGREQAEVELAPTVGNGRHLRLWATMLARPEPLVMLSFEDISLHKEKEARLVATEETLRESNRRKDDFLAMLSHELRNPLAPIRNCLYLLEHVEPGSDRARRAHTVIDEQVAHLTHLVDDLLDVTRINKGKMRLQPESVRFSELTSKTVEAQRASFEGKGLVLELSLEPGEHWILADSTRIAQALSNVLGNAEKFTPRGGNVTVSLHRDGPRAVLEVRDTGIGITPEVARHLFQPFAQAPQTIERAVGGLGLGLATVKGLVELHGGTVAMASEGLGRGTTVTITLPLAVPPAPTVAASAPEPRAASRVLIIEDNRDAADSLRDALSLSGHQVEVAYDGPSGIATAREFHPLVVFCDIGLPGMNGYEVAARFRHDEGLHDVYLVALTGYARPEDLDRALEAGFQRHLAKPPTIEKLLDILGSVPSRDAAPPAP